MPNNQHMIAIGQLSAGTGVSASTIRYYERIGILPKPGRIGGQRRYRPEAADLLSVLRLAQACGFRLEEMRPLIYGLGSDGEPALRWQRAAQRKTADIDLQIKRLTAMRRLVQQVADCKCADLAECGRSASLFMGTRT